MAKKSSKTTTKKKVVTKVSDLSARRDPKGGAQKREGPGAGSSSTPGRPNQRAGKSRL